METTYNNNNNKLNGANSKAYFTQIKTLCVEAVIPKHSLMLFCHSCLLLSATIPRNPVKKETARIKQAHRTFYP